jgi:hypothetical protein
MDWLKTAFSLIYLRVWPEEEESVFLFLRLLRITNYAVWRWDQPTKGQRLFVTGCGTLVCKSTSGIYTFAQFTFYLQEITKGCLFEEASYRTCAADIGSVVCPAPSTQQTF